MIGKILTCLGNSDQVMAHLDGRDAILLDGSRCLITRHLNILQHDGVKTGIFELEDGKDTLLTLL